MRGTHREHQLGPQRPRRRGVRQREGGEQRRRGAPRRQHLLEGPQRRARQRQPQQQRGRAVRRGRARRWRSQRQLQARCLQAQRAACMGAQGVQQCECVASDAIDWLQAPANVAEQTRLSSKAMRWWGEAAVRARTRCCRAYSAARQERKRGSLRLSVEAKRCTSGRVRAPCSAARSSDSASTRRGDHARSSAASAVAAAHACV